MRLFSFINRFSRKKKITGIEQRESKFVIERKKQGIGIKSSLVEFAALERNLNVDRLNKRVILVRTRTNTDLAFTGLNGISSSSVSSRISTRKQDTRHILKKQGISVVESAAFNISEYKNALKYVEKLGFPVVVKPATLSRGRGITTNVQTVKQFKEAWENAKNAYRRRRKNRQLIVEKHIEGNDYRFFVVDEKVISVTQRKRANVVGDGSSTVLELIKNKNEERKKNPYLGDYLIPENREELDRLIENDISLDYVPKNNEELILRSQSNLSAGGDSIDYTDDVHPGFIEIAIKAVQSIPGMSYAGVDFITKDITKKPTKNNHIVSEVEYSPAPLAHFPLVGKRRDMAGAIIDYYLKKYK